jgi:acyl-CoA synthetase (AMP-forming)/AMP-acid ligase II
MNTAEFLGLTSLIIPDRESIIFEKKTITFGELAERVNRLANALSELGVGPGDRVATVQVNTNELVEAYFASARLDAIFVPLNFRARAEELTHMINDCQPKVIMVGPRYTDLVSSIQSNIKGETSYVALEGPKDGWSYYEDILKDAPDDERTPNADDDDTTILLFTAGTTGVPKGVMLTHNSFSSYILSNVSPADPDVEEKNILTVPMYHVAGIQSVLAAIYGGRTLVIQRQFDAEEWMNLVQAQAVDRAMMVPTMLKQLMDHPKFKEHDLSSLKVITYGAAPMPLEVIKRAIRELPNTRFINAFGQTETASTITMLPPDDHILEGTPEEVEIKMKRLASIGKPLPDVEVAIVDENGNPMAIGEVGEIVARGSRLMKGYWNMQAATSETVRGGWLYTGDLGYMDEGSYIFLAGRSKDFIKRGGEMISPEEVEQVLQSHPTIDEAAIIGVPDDEWGERVRAVVVLKQGTTSSEKEIIEYCRQRLASFKKPEAVVFVDQLPRNSLGKVLKRELRDSHSQPIRT